MNIQIDSYHFYNRYTKFIKVMQQRILVSEYNETHHILPKCLGGDDSSENLILLSPREHYIAHMLLAMAYRKNFSIVSAFCQMAHKNVKKKTKHILLHRTYTSKVYQQLKVDLYKMVSVHNTGMVSCRDENDTLRRVSSEEYKKSANLKFHTKGMVCAYSTIAEKMVYVSSTEYQSNKHLYIHHFTGKHRSHWIYVRKEPKPKVYKEPKPKVYKEPKPYTEYEFWIKDMSTSSVFKIKYSEWLILKMVTFTQLGKIKPIKRFRMKKTFTDLHIANISKERKGNIQVFDTILNEHIIVTKDKYNSDIHKTTTAGKVLAKNIKGELCLVTKEEYSSGKYVGQTKGLAKVTDKVTGQIVLVSKDEIANNPGRYEGHMTGKTSVVDKRTGNRIVILKDEYDKNLYCALGNKFFLIQGYDKSTPKKIKNINYFEYLHYPEKFVIIDIEKLTKIYNFMEQQNEFN